MGVRRRRESRLLGLPTVCGSQQGDRAFCPAQPATAGRALFRVVCKTIETNRACWYRAEDSYCSVGPGELLALVARSHHSDDCERYGLPQLSLRRLIRREHDALPMYAARRSAVFLLRSRPPYAQAHAGMAAVLRRLRTPRRDAAWRA